VDLTQAQDLEALRAAAETLEAEAGSAAEAAAWEREISQDPKASIFAGVALKLALGRLRMMEMPGPIHASVIFAVYKENLRLLPASEHPLGEDACREKLRQLRWLFSNTPQHSWDLTVVDDGCPESSGALVREILDDSLLPGEEAQVLWLEDAIAEQLPIVRGLTSTDESQKGGSIRLGLWAATQTRRAGEHIVVFTDADLSTHLGQIGLLAAPLAAGEAEAAIGSRRETASVVVKSGSRDHRGKLFIYLWKRLLPDLHGIADTQCGFKAFSAAHLRTWIETTRDSRFSFDIEALLRVRQAGGGRIARVPIAWIDSEEASTTAEHAPYLPMLKSVAALQASLGDRSQRETPFRELIEGLDDEHFDALVKNVPEAITDRSPLDFDDFDEVSAEDLARILEE
jgi:hypothetical protein